MKTEYPDHSAAIVVGLVGGAIALAWMGWPGVVACVAVQVCIAAWRFWRSVRAETRTGGGMSDTTMPVGRYLDARVAELMGWTNVRRVVVSSGLHVRGCPPGDPSAVRDVPEYSRGIALARQVEERIGARGLREAYAEALTDVVVGRTPPYFSDEEIFQIAHATPEQRCHAALRAVGGDA